MLPGGSRARIGGVDAGHHIEQPGGVFDASAHRARGIALAVERGHALTAHKPDGRTNADQVVIEAGARTLPPVSVPIPTVPKFAAMATPVPPLDPPLA